MASSASSRASPWGLVDPKRIRKREHDKMTALEWEDIIDKWKEGNDIIGRLLSDPSCPGDVVEEYQGWMEQELEELIESVHSRSLETQFRSLFDNLFQTVLRPNLGIYTQEAMSLHEDELSAEEQTAKETLERCLNVVASTVDFLRAIDFASPAEEGWSKTEWVEILLLLIESTRGGVIGAGSVADFLSEMLSLILRASAFGTRELIGNSKLSNTGKKIADLFQRATSGPQMLHLARSMVALLPMSTSNNTLPNETKDRESAIKSFLAPKQHQWTKAGVVAMASNILRIGTGRGYRCREFIHYINTASKYNSSNVKGYPVTRFDVSGKSVLEGERSLERLRSGQVVFYLDRYHGSFLGFDTNGLEEARHIKHKDMAGFKRIARAGSDDAGYTFSWTVRSKQGDREINLEVESAYEQAFHDHILKLMPTSNTRSPSTMVQSAQAPLVSNDERRVGFNSGVPRGRFIELSKANNNFAQSAVSLDALGSAADATDDFEGEMEEGDIEHGSKETNKGADVQDKDNSANTNEAEEPTGHNAILDEANPLSDRKTREDNQDDDIVASDDADSGDTLQHPPARRQKNQPKTPLAPAKSSLGKAGHTPHPRPSHAQSSKKVTLKPRESTPPPIAPLQPQTQSHASNSLETDETGLDESAISNEKSLSAKPAPPRRSGRLSKDSPEANIVQTTGEILDLTASTKSTSVAKGKGKARVSLARKKEDNTAPVIVPETQAPRRASGASVLSDTRSRRASPAIAVPETQLRRALATVPEVKATRKVSSSSAAGPAIMGLGKRQPSEGRRKSQRIADNKIEVLEVIEDEMVDAEGTAPGATKDDAKGDSPVDTTTAIPDKPKGRKSAAAGVKVGKLKKSEDKGEVTLIQTEADQTIHPPSTASGEGTENGKETVPPTTGKREISIRAADKSTEKDELDSTSSDLGTPASQAAPHKTPPPTQMASQSLPIGKPTPVSRSKRTYNRTVKPPPIAESASTDTDEEGEGPRSSPDPPRVPSPKTPARRIELRKVNAVEREREALSAKPVNARPSKSKTKKASTSKPGSKKTTNAIKSVVIVEEEKDVDGSVDEVAVDPIAEGKPTSPDPTTPVTPVRKPVIPKNKRGVDTDGEVRPSRPSKKGKTAVSADGGVNLGSPEPIRKPSMRGKNTASAKDKVDDISPKIKASKRNAVDERVDETVAGHEGVGIEERVGSKEAEDEAPIPDTVYTEFNEPLIDTLDVEDEVIVQSEPKAADPQAKSGPSNKDVNQPVEAKKTTTATAEVGKGVEEGRRAVREALQKARSKPAPTGADGPQNAKITLPAPTTTPTMTAKPAIKRAPHPEITVKSARQSASVQTAASIPVLEDQRHITSSENSPASIETPRETATPRRASSDTPLFAPIGISATDSLAIIGAQPAVKDNPQKSRTSPRSVTFARDARILLDQISQDDLQSQGSEAIEAIEAIDGNEEQTNVVEEEDIHLPIPKTRKRKAEAEAEPSGTNYERRTPTEKKAKTKHQGLSERERAAETVWKAIDHVAETMKHRLNTRFQHSDQSVALARRRVLRGAARIAKVLHKEIMDILEEDKEIEAILHDDSFQRVEQVFTKAQADSHVIFGALKKTIKIGHASMLKSEEALAKLLKVGGSID